MHWVLWAKSGPPAHPLWCHLIDVGAVAEALWDAVLTESAKTRMSRALGFDSDIVATRTWVVWLAALHDIGKAAAEFQFQDEALKKRVAGAGFKFDGRETRLPHGAISADIIHEELKRRGPWSTKHRDAIAIASAIGAHHGLVESSRRGASNKPCWTAARAQLIATVEVALGLEATREAAAPAQPVDHALLLEVAGFVSYADWIGSMSEHFSMSNPAENCALFAGESLPAEYAERARSIATALLPTLGFRRMACPKVAADWSAQFPSMKEPRPLQREVEAILRDEPDVRLLIVEAPMGEGKTEAALFAARHWIDRHQQPGMYLALPTQATSNAMYRRVDEWLARVFGVAAVESLLVHGGLLPPAYYEDKKRETYYFAALGHRIEVHDEGAGEQGPKAPATMAHEWFLSTKKSLLANCGTGTIDQALLGAMRVKHNFIRLAGLAGKTVVLDEVHAYDAYTGRLLARLLEYLAKLECTVILLSATLPAARRAALLAAFSGAAAETDDSRIYPSITAWSPERGAHRPRTFATSERAAKTLRIIPMKWELDAALAQFKEELGGEGCGAFIVNTVNEAQKAYRRAIELFGADNLHLFHSRFTAAERARIEEKVLRLFGKSDPRPERTAILIATQVVEQSLDLDFDVMATCIAPIDLVLQRSGRLHRHERPRPPHHAIPQLFVRMPEVTDTAPVYGGTGRVYEPAVLMRTQVLLERIVRSGEGEGRLAIPGMIADLIAEVYSDAAQPDLPQAWRVVYEKAQAEMVKRIREEDGAAQGRALLPLRMSSELWDFPEDNSIPPDHDTPQAHDDKRDRALTRLGDESLRVLCLNVEAETGEPFIEKTGERVQRTEMPGALLVRQLLGQVASVPRNWFARGKAPGESDGVTRRPYVAWQQHRALKHLPVLEFRNGRYIDVPTGWEIRWDKDTGLEVIREPR